MSTPSTSEKKEVDQKKKKTTQQTEQLKEWPQPASVDELKEYFKILTLAVHQPDEKELRVSNEQDIPLLVPFARKECTNIYPLLEDKVTEWYTNRNGGWLTKEIVLNWLGESSQQDLPLVNPLINPFSKIQLTRQIQFPDLKLDTQKYLLEQEIDFQGTKIQLKHVLGSVKAEEVMDSKMINLLTQNKEKTVKIGKKWVDSNGFDAAGYIPRTICWPTLRSNFDQEAGGVADKLKVFQTEREFQQCTGNAVLIEGAMNTVLEFKGSSDAIYRYIDETRPAQFAEEELLDKVKGVAVISDTAGMGKSTILTHLCYILKMKQHIQQPWIFLFDLNDYNFMKTVDENLNSSAYAFLEQFGAFENEFEVKSIDRD